MLSHKFCTERGRTKDFIVLAEDGKRVRVEVAVIERFRPGRGQAGWVERVCKERRTRRAKSTGNFVAVDADSRTRQTRQYR